MIVRLWAISLVLLMTMSVPCSGADGDDGKRILEGMVRAINDRDFQALDQFVAQDVRRHSGATPGVHVENLEQFKEFLKSDLAGFPDATQEINMIISEGNMIAIHATYRGTQTGPFGPFPPSGKSLELPFIGILRIQDGKIAEIWVEWDNLNALIQLGHFSPPEQKGN